MPWSVRFRAVLFGAVFIGLSACGGGGSSPPARNPPPEPPVNRTQWDTLVWDTDNWG